VIGDVMDVMERLEILWELNTPRGIAQIMGTWKTGTEGQAGKRRSSTTVGSTGHEEDPRFDAWRDDWDGNNCRIGAWPPRKSCWHYGLAKQLISPVVCIIRYINNKINPG